MTECVKIRCDDCKFVDNCVDYGWDGCRKFTPTPSEPMTNEEWLRTASTEQLAEWLAFLVYEVCICKNGGRGVAEEISKLQKMQNAEFIKKFNEVNSPCEHCGCNPKNGGSGLCNCTLACPKIIC